MIEVVKNEKDLVNALGEAGSELIGLVKGLDQILYGKEEHIVKDVMSDENVLKTFLSVIREKAASAAHGVGVAGLYLTQDQKQQ